MGMHFDSIRERVDEFREDVIYECRSLSTTSVHFDVGSRVEVSRWKSLLVVRRIGFSIDCKNLSTLHSEVD